PRKVPLATPAPGLQDPATRHRPRRTAPQQRSRSHSRLALRPHLHALPDPPRRTPRRIRRPNLRPGPERLRAALGLESRSYFATWCGDALPNNASSRAADAGAFTFPSRTISFALISRPYSALFAPSSDRIVDPSSDTPANSPCAREYERISAFITTSVSAEVSRPTGPAAADASAPSFTLLDIIEFAPDSFITSNTKSVAWPPIWNPTLAPSSANIAGALHPPVNATPL